MMAKAGVLVILVYLLAIANISWADTFGSGVNQFTIDFVTISGNTNPASGIPAGSGFTFTGVTNDYRIGKYEINNDQWNKFKAAYGTVTGSPSNTYASDSYWTGANMPTNNTCWYEAAQFVNFLNTSKGYQAAYKFTGTQGTRDYTLAVWEVDDSGYNMNNPYRNSNAFYFLPTENEWVKAACWNGANLQTYATKAGETLFQGNGSNGGWNYDRNTIQQPWNVGSGSEELNGTFDMMGNVWEWMESPYDTGSYLSDSYRVVRGGAYSYYYPGNGDGDHDSLVSSNRDPDGPLSENIVIGFRVASEIPEPASLLLLCLGGLLIRKR
jgi:formylglycine-generating enzyme required for sulfatase activity